MITSSYGKAFLYYWILCGETHRLPVVSPNEGPVIRKFDILFDVTLNILLNKQSSYRWFETLRCPRDVAAVVRQQNLLTWWYRDHSVYVPSKWETALQCNVISLAGRISRMILHVTAMLYKSAFHWRCSHHNSNSIKKELPNSNQMSATKSCTRHHYYNVVALAKLSSEIIARGLSH